METKDYLPLISPLQVGECASIDPFQVVIFNPDGVNFNGWDGVSNEQLLALAGLIENELGCKVSIQFERTKSGFEFRLGLFSDKFENGNTSVQGWPEILPLMVEQARALLAAPVEVAPLAEVAPEVEQVPIKAPGSECSAHEQFRIKDNKNVFEAVPHQSHKDPLNCYLCAFVFLGTNCHNAPNCTGLYFKKLPNA